MEFADFVRLGNQSPPLRFLISKSSAMRETIASADLELCLPEDSGFISRPPRVSLALMLKRSRQLRVWFPAGSRTPEERWQAKTAEEFKL